MVKRQEYDYGNPYMNKDMSRIVLKLIVLRRIQKSAVHSYALLKEIESSPHMSKFIQKHGGIVKNDVYNTVNALEKSGYIVTKARIVAGRLKKDYTITNSGKKALHESKSLFMKSMRELMDIIK